jgi:hypothetical protein
METKVISSLVFITIFGCNNPSTIKGNDHLKPSLKKTSEIVEVNKNDYYKLHFMGDTAYFIEWGNKLYKNETKRTFDVLGSGNVTTRESSNDAIILSQGCGTSCTYYIVLPLKAGSKEKVFMQAIASNISKNIVAYIPEEEEPFIRIENYLTGKKLDIVEKNLCPAAFKGDCIDTSYFKGNNFIVKWQGSKWNDDKKDPQEKIVVIDF